MSTEKDTSVAAQLIYYHPTMTLSTVSTDGEPWASHCMVAYDSQLSFYWSSPYRSTHSQNIRARGKAVLSASNDNMPPNEGLGKGIYIRADASELADEDSIARALQYLSGRNGERPRRSPDVFLDGDVRLYQAVPYDIRVNHTVVNNEGLFVSSSESIALGGLVQVVNLMHHQGNVLDSLMHSW